jgi:alkylation response protein AidB-like acyl-CoA dehydrogenase
MRLDLEDDQELFRTNIRKLLAQRVTPAEVRDLWESSAGYHVDFWRTATEIGCTAAYVSESDGGGCVSGRPTEDAAIAAEEIGRAAAPGPFIPVNVVAAALARDGSPSHREQLLPGLVNGTTIATWAVAEPKGIWDGVLPVISTTAKRAGDEFLLHGEKAYVEAAAAADVFLVTARTEAGLTQLLVPSERKGVTVVSGRSLDMTRRFGRVVFDDVVLPATSIVGELGNAASSVERQLQIALVLQCAETVGATDRVFETTIEYSRDRYAFGRPIASFQALKHRIADMFQWLEFAKAITDAAARAVDDESDDAATMVSVTKAYVASRCTDIVDDCVQLSGGIGVTWEHDLHLYSRRVAVNRALFGTPEQHRERLATLLFAQTAEGP